MTTTPELNDLLARARTQPGVTEVMRIYGASQLAMSAAASGTAPVRVISSNSANVRV
jgi:hypothetical protein